MEKPAAAYFQRYHGAGRAVISAESPAQYGSAVKEALLYPGVLTIEPILNIDKFKEALAAGGVPPAVVEEIGRSLKLLEDEAYFVQS